RLMVPSVDAEGAAKEMHALGTEPSSPQVLEAMLTPSRPGETYEAALEAVQAQLEASVLPELRPFLVRAIARRRAVRSVGACLQQYLFVEPARVETAFRAAYRALWKETVVPMRDSSLTGDQILDVIARGVPPGVHASIMGVQNIKGTGLDFVYRWVSI